MITLALAGCTGPQPTDPQPASPNYQAAPVINIDRSPAGSVPGVISFKGAAPKLPALDMSQDPACPNDRQPSEAIVLKSNKLANVFVYVKDGLPTGRFPAPAEPAVLDQKGCRYLPNEMGIMDVQSFKGLNSELAQHNVHPIPSRDSPSSESPMPMGPAITKTLANTDEMVDSTCH